MENLSIIDKEPKWMKPLYAIGDELKLRLPSIEKPISVEIDHIYEKKTAAVLRVKLRGDLPAELQKAKDNFVILKVYDRRHALRAWGLKDLTSRSEDPFGKDYELGVIAKPPQRDEDPGYLNFVGDDEESFEYIKQLAGAHEIMGLPAPKIRFTGPGTQTYRGSRKFEELLAGAEIVENTEAEHKKQSGRGKKPSAEQCGDCKAAWRSAHAKCPRHQESWAKEFTEIQLNERLRQVQLACLEQYFQEQQVYERLKPLQQQGKLPTYLSAVELVIDRDEPLPALPEYDSPTSQSIRPHQSTATRIKQYLSIPGALLTFIDGVPLSHLEKIAPPSAQQPLLTSALALLNSTHACDILHKRVRPEKILIRTHHDRASGTTAYTPVLIDLADSRTRRLEEYTFIPAAGGTATRGIAHWHRQKLLYNEEGALGARMYRLLGREGPFPLTRAGTLQFVAGAEAEDDKHAAAAAEDCTTSALLCGGVDGYGDPIRAEEERRARIAHNALCDWSGAGEDAEEEEEMVALKRTVPFPRLESGLVSTGNASVPVMTVYLD